MAFSVLDDPATQDRVVEAVTSGARLADIGAQIGLSRQAITNYLAKHAAFKARVDAARERSKIASERLPAPVLRPNRKPDPERRAEAARSIGVAVELVSDASEAPGPDVPELVEKAWQTALDVDEHPGVRAKCWDIVATYKLRPLMLAAERKAQREVERTEQLEAAEAGDGPLVISLPDSGAHAPRGHGATIDVEVLDG